MSEVEEKKEELELSEVDQAFVAFNYFAGMFRKYSYSLSKRKKRSVARVLEALLFDPLQEELHEDLKDRVVLQGKEEWQLFDICQQVLHNKAIVLKELEKIRQEREKLKGETNEQTNNKTEE